MNVPVVEMVVRSGWIARCILIILGIFSIMAWTIIINKFVVLRKAAKGNKDFMRKYAECTHLTGIEAMDAIALTSPVGILGATAVTEYKRIISDSEILTGVKDWSFFLQNQFSMFVEKMEMKFSETVRYLDKGLVILAISSSVAPFIGLLGTVWGIMNSFYQIGDQGSASLPVVAPGIAEALIATILGLAVAIPAVLFYNYYMHRVERIENEMDEVKNLLQSQLKRDVFNLLYGNSAQS